ncbi:MAG TPA: AI-2E family transporter [Candidatus Limnocylindrales bacterium]|nr:AI-2E family transporter [Candidatus Limnocylindrales bacterium]
MPAWLRSAGSISWRLLAVTAAVLAVLYLLAVLRVVVLPVIVALLATTLLLPPVRALKRRGLPPAAAVAVVMVGAALLLAAVIAAIAPSIAGQADELGTGVQDGIRQVGDVLADRPFNLSEQEIRDRIDEGIDRLRENSGPVTEGVQTGAVLLGEIITGLILTVLLTFFFLKDGEGMWRWITDFAGPDRRRTWDEVGARVFTALGGYVRGIALVGLVDAALIGIALLVIGVPLVVPLMVLTFIAAFLPLIGAFLAGLAAVLIALVFNGLVAALLVLGVIVLVQQIEGHLLYPLLMGRAVHLHPAVIIIALGIGGILAGIVGVFLAVPVAGVISVILSHARREPPPDTPITDDLPVEATRAPAAG